MLNANKLIFLISIILISSILGCDNDHSVTDTKKIDKSSASLNPSKEETISFIKDKVMGYKGSLLGGDDIVFDIQFDSNTCVLDLKSKSPRFSWIFHNEVHLSRIDLYKTVFQTRDDFNGINYYCESGTTCATQTFDGKLSDDNNYFQLSVSSDVQARKIKKAFDYLVAICQKKELF